MNINAFTGHQLEQLSVLDKISKRKHQNQNLRESYSVENRQKKWFIF